MNIAQLAKFSRIGAADNNLVNPALNPTPNTPELSIAPPNFQPGTERGLVDGPNARSISDIVASGPAAENEDSSGVSAWSYVMGQFVDHDLDLEAVDTTDIGVTVPADDTELVPGSEIPLTRAIVDPTTGTITNTVAGFLDLSQIYGSDQPTADRLRNPDGTLRTSDGNAPPLRSADEPTGVFTQTPVGSFVSGDVRVTEQPELTAVTTLFLREHNYWVGILKAQDPTLTGDQLYNQARAITTAEYQNIVYTEFLPSLLGKNALPAYSGYDPTVNTQVSQEFSTAAFRVGHSQVSGTQTRIDNDGNVTGTQSLADAFFNTPAQDLAGDGINGLLRNLSSDVSQQVDAYTIDDLRDLLAASPAQFDLIATDIQRGRDVGLGTLNETRAALGLAAYKSFDEVSSDPTVQAHLASAYGTVDQVDLFMGGLAEDLLPGSDVGQTFETIIAEQFERLRAGDRFWWQNEDFDSHTAQMIGQTTLGDIIERQTGTPAEQPDVFVAATRHSSAVAPEDPGAAQLVIGVDDNGAAISGGPADDTIVAGLGLDQILSGGGGSDIFVFNGGGHTDSIANFDVTNDAIEFQALMGSNAASEMMAALGADAAAIAVYPGCGSAVVQFGGNTITLPGVDPKELTRANFLTPPGTDVGVAVLG